MANSPNKYAEGFRNVLNTFNIGFTYCGYNFPESTAQDRPGALAFSFQGGDTSSIPYSTSKTRGYGYGPSGFDAYWTSIRTLNDADIYKFQENGGNNGPGFTASAISPSSPNLKSIFVEHPPASATVNNQRAFTSVNTIATADLVCEGPIEGFVTGQYSYGFENKTTGSIGYSSATFTPFSNLNSSLESPSIYWNNTPVSDVKGFFNFQYVNYRYTYGENNNEHTVFNPKIYLYEDRYDYYGSQVDKFKIPLETTTTRSIGERLYGAYLSDTNTKIRYPKTYYIYNTDLSSIEVNIKVLTLFEQILDGTETAGDVEFQEVEVEIEIFRVLNDNTLVALDTSKYSPHTASAYSNDLVFVEGKVQSSPNVFTYHINLRPYAENFPNFSLFKNQIGWAITLTKNTLEGGGSTLQTTTQIDSISEIYSDRFVHPGCAIIYSRFDARYFSAIPERSYNLRLLKVKIPINYNPITKTYDGAWNGKFKLAWTDNPAWCFYDMITNNRYGLGKYIDKDLTDKWTLYEISKYCDELVSNGIGGLEPRFTCNLYINTREEAYKILNDMASIFRGIIYYSAGQILTSQDSPKKPIYIFNNSNVIGGEFIYSDASRRARSTTVLVRYNDKNDNYKPAIEYVEDRQGILKHGIREKEISAFGCTSKTQARRIGKWLLVTDNEDTEMVDFRVGLEGYYIKPGDVISVYDQNRRNKIYAGRTLELSANHAVLDLDYNQYNLNILTGINESFKFQIITPTYNLQIGTDLANLYSTGFSDIKSDGISGINSEFIKRAHIQDININNPSSFLTSGSGIYKDYIRLNLPQPLDSINYNLLNNTNWIIEIDQSSFNGVLNARSEINNPSLGVYPGYYLEPFLDKPQKYRVLSIKENENNNFSISALMYNEQKYFNIDNSATLIDKPIKPGIPPPPNLFLTGLFRDLPKSGYGGNNYAPTGSPSIPYQQNQSGINSIIYQILPTGDTEYVSLYTVYVKSGNFDGDGIDNQFLEKTLSFTEVLQNGLNGTNWENGTIPPFVTPLYTGVYSFRVYASNFLNERSSYVEKKFNFINQAPLDSVTISGVNLL